MGTLKGLGIDLGTTNTLVAINQDIKGIDSSGREILPSVVAYPPSGSTVVGTAARRRKLIDPENTIFSSKRLIGKRWHSSARSYFEARYPLQLIAKEDGIAFKTRGGVNDSVDVAMIVVASVIEKLALDPAVHHVCIAVPAAFDAAQREATLSVGTRLGFGQASLIDEPVAAALAYIGRYQTPVKYAAVYDFGGGTLDVSILDCSKEPYHVMARDGDLSIGGDDIDLALADYVAQQVLVRHQWDLSNNKQTYAKLVYECEQAKVALSRHDEAIIDLGMVDPSMFNDGQEYTIPRAALEKTAQELIQRSFLICDAVFSNAGVDPRELDSIFTVGGSTLIPAVRQRIEEYFCCPPIQLIDPIRVVAVGASIAAEMG